MNIDAIKEKYIKCPCHYEINKSDIFIDICKRYTSLKFDYSVPLELKIQLQNMMQKEMARLMQPQY